MVTSLLLRFTPQVKCTGPYLPSAPLLCHLLLMEQFIPLKFQWKCLITLSSASMGTLFLILLLAWSLLFFLSYTCQVTDSILWFWGFSFYDLRFNLCKQVSKHTNFQDTRCFYVVSTDGAKQDFSTRKCLENLVRSKYPDKAETFNEKYFKKLPPRVPKIASPAPAPAPAPSVGWSSPYFG